MKKSDFSFSNPQLVEFDYCINQDYDFTSKDKVGIDVNVDVDIKRNDDLQNAIVELTVTVGQKGRECPFYVKGVEGAIFEWSSEMKPVIDELLNQNAPAVLLGYLRPIISMITASSGITPYNLPLINFKRD